jgi:hypothetical protein
MARLTVPASHVPGSDPRTCPERTSERGTERGGVVPPSRPPVAGGRFLGSDPGTGPEETLWHG